ncbi:Rhs family protein [Vibrio sp. JCM 19053]|nr:Rhs family protein [Vibrio sp. JCM 19053]
MLFVERSIIGGITNMQSTISSGLTQQVWGSQYWHSIKKSELNTSDYELTERNKAKIDECLKERQEAMDARASKEGYHAQIGNINQQSAKIGELVTDDFIRNIRPNAKLSHPKDLAT